MAVNVKVPLKAINLIITCQGDISSDNMTDKIKDMMNFF